MSRNEARSRLNLPRIADADFDMPVTRLDMVEGQDAKPAPRVPVETEDCAMRKTGRTTTRRVRSRRWRALVAEGERQRPSRARRRAPAAGRRSAPRPGPTTRRALPLRVHRRLVRPARPRTSSTRSGPRRRAAPRASEQSRAAMSSTASRSTTRSGSTAPVETWIEGLAATIASVIAMAGPLDVWPRRACS